MRRFFLRNVFVSALVATAVFSGAARAQEQTAENAQRFIAQIAGLGQMTYAYRHIFNNNFNGYQMTFEQSFFVDSSGDADRAVWYDKTIAPLWDIESSSRCNTAFSFKGTVPTTVAPSSLDDIATQDMSESMDWGRVTSVEVKGAYVFVSQPGRIAAEVFHRFGLPSTDLAARMGYAMTVLRVSCDQTGGTGF